MRGNTERSHRRHLPLAGHTEFPGNTIAIECAELVSIEPYRQCLQRHMSDRLPQVIPRELRILILGLVYKNTRDVDHDDRRIGCPPRRAARQVPNDSRVHMITPTTNDEGPRLRVARRRRQPRSIQNRVDRNVTDDGIRIKPHRTVPTQNRRMDHRNTRHLADTHLSSVTTPPHLDALTAPSHPLLRIGEEYGRIEYGGLPAVRWLFASRPQGLVATAR